MSTSSSSANNCPKCGAALPSAATAGLCPRCLMAEAMVPTQGDAEPAAMRRALSPAELAPHFPQLEILECLGRGGMGVVYKARQKSLKRLVALKLLAPERVADAKFAERFTQEAQALAKLNHPSIVTIYDFGQAGGFYFLLMEFVDGVNLRQAMKAGQFTPEQALAVVPPVCEALQYAHEHGIIHRDIKPENLLLDKEGRVKIADFGIAKILGAPATDHAPCEAETGSERAGTPGRRPALQLEGTLASAAGTPQYMAPEQKAHHATDHRADIYSLGVVLYEMLTGELPADKLQPPSRKMQIDVRLDEIVLRALEMNPELRYQTALELRTQVETVVATPRGAKSGNSVPTAPAALPESDRSPLGYSAMFFATSSAILGAWIWSGLLAPSHAAVFSILLSALLGVSLALPVRRTGRGKYALVIGSMNCAVWLILAIAGLGAQNKPAAAPLAPVALGFGPVMERTLTNLSALDLVTGQVTAMPASAASANNGDQFDEQVTAWMQRAGVDFAYPGDGWLHGVALNMVTLRPDEWADCTPGRLAERLRGESRILGVKFRRDPSTSDTVGFKCRDGRLGLLQITGLTDNSRGIQIRYKLVQDGVASKAAAAKTVMDATPAFGPVMERVLPSGVPCREQLFQFYSGQVFVVGNGPGTSKEEAAYDEQKIEDAGGIDMSAGSNDEGVSIAGRGCFFTQDVAGLTWNRITAGQVMQAMKRVSFVDGVVSPKKKELPVTYLFKTARGEVGIMEVLGVVDDKRDGWIGKGMKFRYKLVQGTGTTTPVAATKSSLVFGPEARGLQAAIEVTPGEPFQLRIHLRNASDRGIAIDGAGYRQDDECLLADAEGRPVPVTKVPHDIQIGMKGGYFGAGQAAVFESAGLSFQDIDEVPSSAGYVAKARPGRYTLRFRLRLPGDDVPFAAGENVWKGELETGPVTIEVKDPSTQRVAPVADSIWSSVLGPAVERTVNDLQTTRENCALSFDSGKLLPVPANITLDTLTNPSAQPVAVAWARDNQVDAVAFVTIDAGRIVKCGLLCPGLVVFRANNKEWNPNGATPQDLKQQFDEAMREWKEIPQIAEVTSDDDFPATYMILDTRTRRRGVLQVMGVADNPRGVKIRYRMVEGAAVKKIPRTKEG